MMMNSLLEGTIIFSRISGLAQPPFAVELAYEREFPKQLYAYQLPCSKLKHAGNYSLVENTGALTTHPVEENETLGGLRIGIVVSSTHIVTNDSFVVIIIAAIIIVARRGARGGSRSSRTACRSPGGRNIDRDGLGFGDNASITLVLVGMRMALDMLLSALIFRVGIRVVHSEFSEYYWSTEMHGKLI